VRHKVSQSVALEAFYVVVLIFYQRNLSVLGALARAIMSRKAAKSAKEMRFEDKIFAGF